MEKEVVYAELGGTWDKHEGNDGGFIIRWGIANCGFGEFAFYKKGDKVFCDTECMSKETVKKVMMKFLDSIECVDR